MNSSSLFLPLKKKANWTQATGRLSVGQKHQSQPLLAAAGALRAAPGRPEPQVREQGFDGLWDCDCPCQVTLLLAERMSPQPLYNYCIRGAGPVCRGCLFRDQCEDDFRNE